MRIRNEEENRLSQKTANKFIKNPRMVYCSMVNMCVYILAIALPQSVQFCFKTLALFLMKDNNTRILKLRVHIFEHLKH